jgi:hypothetical protein
MKFWDNFVAKWQGWLEDAKEFSYNRWGTIWFVGALVAGGGLLSAFFGWGFAFFVPGWLVLVAFMLKKKYKG